MRIIHATALLLLLAACGNRDIGQERSDGGGVASAPDASGGGEPDSCGPWSCDGCCDDDGCRPGDDDDECGAGGADCQSCGRWGECSDAAICELAAATRWDVVASSASLSASNHAGGDWDGSGDLPDVYLRATLVDPAPDDVRSERTAARETLTPSWDETLFTDVPAAALEGMQLEIFDEDGNADDSAGICTAAVRLEDAEAGVLQVDCPRSLASGTGEVPARAGWTVLLRLEPRSDGRPAAPPLDRNAIPALAVAPGSCDITRSMGDQPVELRSYDTWGREVRREQPGDDTFTWDCSGEDHCEVAGALPLVRRMEPGPFGWRVRVEEGDVDSRRVTLYDGLGRVAVRQDYDQEGRLLVRTALVYSAMRRVERVAVWGGVPGGEPVASTEFDDRGSPILLDGPILVEKVDLDAGGLPVRYRVTESPTPDVPVGTTWDVAYDGAGCAAALAGEVTNGALRR